MCRFFAQNWLQLESNYIYCHNIIRFRIKRTKLKSSCKANNKNRFETQKKQEIKLTTKRLNPFLWDNNPLEEENHQKEEVDISLAIVSASRSLKCNEEQSAILSLHWKLLSWTIKAKCLSLFVYLFAVNRHRNELCQLRDLKLQSNQLQTVYIYIFLMYGKRAKSMPNVAYALKIETLNHVKYKKRQRGCRYYFLRIHLSTPLWKSWMHI